jgi:hypothetical protein
VGVVVAQVKVEDGVDVGAQDGDGALRVDGAGEAGDLVGGIAEGRGGLPPNWPEGAGCR